MSIREQLQALLTTENKTSIVGAVNEVSEKAKTADTNAKAANTSVQNHAADNIKHITSAERTAWNAKVSTTALAAQKTELSGLISTNATNITGLRTDVNKNKSDIATLTTNHNSLSTKVTTNQTNISAVTTNVTNLTNTVSSLTNTVNGKEQKIVQAAAAPASPASGQLWIDTSSTPNTMKRWSGLAWATIGSVVDESKFVKATGGSVTGTLNLNNTGGALVLPVGTNRYAT